MDLPSCPSCGQSVLDDDAVDCPFCGASMSGKPKPKPAATPSGSGTATAAAPAKSAPAAASPSRPTAKAQPAKPAKKKPSGDDPFEFERGSEDKSIRLRLQPSPGRRHEVVCPMCETVGYTSRKAAGMNVHCANPDCQLPVFKAPALTQAQIDEEKAANAPERKASDLLTPLNIGVAVGVLLVGGWAVWFFGIGTTPPPKNNGGSRIVGPPEKTEPVKTPENAKTKKIVKRDPIAEYNKFLTEVLTAMLRNVELVELGVAKPAAWQMTIDAHVQTGELKTASDKLEPLRVVSQGASFFEVQPLVALAWGNLKLATPESQTKAGELLTKALEKIATVPRQGRQRHDLAAELAAALIATGRMDDAKRLIAAHNDDGENGQLSLFRHTAFAVNNGDAEATFRNRPFLQAKSPQAVAATILTAAHGHWLAAWNWAKSQDSASARNECQSAWAELRGILPVRDTADNEAALPDPIQLLQQLSAGDAAAVLARSAIHRHDAGNTKEAQTLLTQARARLKAVSMPQPAKVLSIKDTIKRTPPSADEKRKTESLAAGFAELARAELRLNADNSEAAAQSFLQSLAVLQSLAPSLTAADQLLKDIGTPTVRSQIKTEFGTNEDAEVNLYLQQYRAALRGIQKESARRFAVMSRFIEVAAFVRNGRPIDRIWKTLMEPGEAPHRESPEMWLKTRIPALLAEQADATGDAKLAAAIRDQMQKANQRPTLKQIFWQETRRMMAAKDPGDAAALFHDRRFQIIAPAWRETLAMLLVSRLVNSGDMKTAYDFGRRLRDPILRLELFNLLGRQAAAAGKAKELWALAQVQNFRAEETVALCHGLIAEMKPPAVKPDAKTAMSLTP